MSLDTSPKTTPELPVSGKPRRRLGWVVILLVGAAAASAVWWYWRPQRPVSVLPGVAIIAEEEVALPEETDPGYVGPQACAPCHAKRVAEFQSTSHFRACREAKAGDMPPGFEPGKGALRTHDPSLRFEMTQVGSEFFQNAIRTTSTGEKRSTQRIDLVYGAARADEVFFSWHDDRLYELTAVWLHPLNRWAHVTYNHLGSGEFTREATPRCLECHNTRFDHVAGSVNQYRRDHLMLGVSCERCHGPGRDHVHFHQQNPQAAEGHDVVHPGRLARERRIEVCTQCHSNTPRGRGPSFRYRPGEPLEKYYRTSPSKYPEDDHVANQIAYLRQSKCFQKDERLGCTTCHNPHRANNPTEVADACKKCHKPEHCTEQPHLPAAVRDNCVGCHMPARVWMNVHFHTSDDLFVPAVKRHDHRIAVHPAARNEVLLAHYRKQADDAGRREAGRLQGELTRYWLAEADTRQQKYRFLASIGAFREALAIDPSPSVRDRLRQVVTTQDKINTELVEALAAMQSKRFDEAIITLKKILAVKPDFAVAHGKLGTAYAATGQTALAVQHLRAVSRDNPDDPYGYMMLGWLAYLEGRTDEAVENYRRADEIEPFNSKTHYHWGLALMKASRWAGADEQFRQALLADPDHAGACQGVSHALWRQGRLGKALGYARRAAVLTNFKNADVLITLAEIQADAGLLSEADKTAARALAETVDPRLAARIVQLRQKYQARRADNR